jgi:hypothetical protein
MNNDKIACTRRKVTCSFKILRVTKLLLILACASIFQVNAASYGQVVTLNIKDAPLKEVFNELKKQTGYHFLYKTEMLSKIKNINIRATNEPLVQVLEKCFENQGITYAINDNTVVLRERPTELSFNNYQTRVTGTVTDQTGLPMPGVGIKVKGGTATGVTDANGKYVITAAGNSTLIFSFVGYAAQEIPVGGRTIVDARLLESQAALSEVVVIGYGTVRRTDLTGCFYKRRRHQSAGCE